MCNVKTRYSHYFFLLIFNFLISSQSYSIQLSFQALKLAPPALECLPLHVVGRGRCRGCMI
jgi:hypothetical protein